MNKHIKKVIIIFVISALGTTNSFAQTKSKVAKARLILDSIVQSKDFVGLSAAIVYRGKLVLSDGFGYKNIESKEKPDEDTIFRIYSTSKPLTGLLAMKLVEEGQLNLDMPIGEIMPTLPEHLHAITSKHLLGHLSGIRHYNGWDEWNEISNNNCQSPLEALDVFINDPLLFTPGEKVSYTSFGYVLLSAIQEKVGGDPFSQLMSEKVIAPSRAKHIQLDEATIGQLKNVTKFYDLENGDISLTRQVNNSCKFGGGSFNASAKAVAKILRAYMSKKLFDKTTYLLSISQIKPNNGEMIYTAHTGIGANIKEGRLSAVSNGAGPGGRSTIFMYPDDEIAVVIIGNSMGRKLRKDAEKIANIFL